MAKALTALLVMGMLTISSCKKNSDPAGSWTFEGVTYDVSGCSTASYTLNASNVNNNNANDYGTIGINFYHTLPTANGTYKVVRNPPAANQVSMIVSLYNINLSQQINYTSTGGTGTDSVKVTVAQNGFLTVSGTGIELVNSSGGSDSSGLTFNITQTQ